MAHGQALAERKAFAKLVTGLAFVAAGHNGIIKQNLYAACFTRSGQLGRTTPRSAKPPHGATVMPPAPQAGDVYFQQKSPLTRRAFLFNIRRNEGLTGKPFADQRHLR